MKIVATVAAVSQRERGSWDGVGAGWVGSTYAVSTGSGFGDVISMLIMM